MCSPRPIHLFRSKCQVVLGELTSGAKFDTFRTMCFNNVVASLIFMVPYAAFSTDAFNVLEFSTLNLFSVFLYAISSILGYGKCFWLLFDLIQVFIFMSLEFENAVVNGLIEDFATVVCFFIDYLAFDMQISIWSLIGCFLVAFVILWINFGEL